MTNAVAALQPPTNSIMPVGGSNVIGTVQPAQTAAQRLAQQIRTTWGGNWDEKGIDRAQELADLLAAKGVQNLGDLQIVNTDQGRQIKIGDQTLGFVGDYNNDNSFGSKAGDYLQDNGSDGGRVAWSARGDGNVSYDTGINPDTGKLEIRPSWGRSSTSFNDVINKPFTDTARMAGALGASQDVQDALGAGPIGVDSYFVGQTGRAIGGRVGEAVKDEAERNIDHPERAVGRAAVVAALIYGGMSAAAAESAVPAGATTMTASEQVALMAANGMTDVEIAAAMGTAGSNAAGLTGVTGGMANAAGATGATNGYWNGTDFSGAAPQAGSSNIGSALTQTGAAGASGAAGMGATDWINLAQLAAGVWATNEAGNASQDATNAAQGVAQGQLKLSQDALDWYKATYAEQAPARAAAETRAQQISDAQLRAMTSATDQADELYNYNKTTFRPLEQRLVSEAQSYDTPERRMAAAASAAADIDVSTAEARKANDRALARSGFAPGSAKAMALSEDSAVAQGRNRGSAMTGAVRNVEQQGYARMADAANMGRGIASQQATQQQIATTTGNSSVANSGGALQAAQSGNQFMGNGYNTAISGMSSAGNLFNQVAGQQNQQDQMLLNGVNGIGQFMGRTYGTSDKNKKTGTGKAADGKKALAEIDATKVDAGWKYKDDPAQTPRVGPMAQEVNRVSGEAAAPGGKVIDLVSQQGRMLSAIKQLSKDVKALKKSETKDESEDEKEAA